MFVTLRYILLTALRDRLMAGLALVLVGAVLVSGFLGEATFMEEREMALSFAGFSTRLILVAGLILFVCFHVQRSFENREIDLMLSRPISRPGFVLITWVGFSGVAVLMALVAVVLLPLAGWPARGGLALWTASLILESLLVVAVALFFALTLRTAVGSALATLGFYLLARIAGFLIGVVESDRPTLAAHDTLGVVLGHAVYAIGLILPRLDLFGQTWWLAYGDTAGGALLPVVAQAAVYIPLLLAAAVFDFRRRRF